jgi:dipeptidase E
MKLLLTSSGLTNPSITKALFDLVGKKSDDTSVVFIPTAANVENGDKDWFITDLINLLKQNFKQIEIADISAVDEKIWRPRLEQADVIFFEGGNTYYLMEWINRSGLAKILRELLGTRVYVGVSAGSMVTNPDLALKLSKTLYGEDLERTEIMPGLNFVDFYILPHLNSKYFPKLRKELIEEASKDVGKKIYALDDNSAIKIDGDTIEIVSEGEWLEFN